MTTDDGWRDVPVSELGLTMNAIARLAAKNIYTLGQAWDVLKPGSESIVYVDIFCRGWQARGDGDSATIKAILDRLANNESILAGEIRAIIAKGGTLET